jgi:hypothetical protein
MKRSRFAEDQIIGILKEHEGGISVADLCRKPDCDACALKSRCHPKEPQRKVTRSIFEPSRDVARAIAQTTQLNRPGFTGGWFVQRLSDHIE